MYALIKDSAVVEYPYSIFALKANNPNVSFPSATPVSLLNEYGVFEVRETAQPVVQYGQVVEEAEIVQQDDGSWVQSWTVRAMTTAELTSISAENDERRRAAYQQEADPLFFKWQRGEATEQQWRDKIAEIKSRA